MPSSMVSAEHLSLFWFLHVQPEDFVGAISLIGIADMSDNRMKSVSEQ